MLHISKEWRECTPHVVTSHISFLQLKLCKLTSYSNDRSFGKWSELFYFPLSSYIFLAAALKLWKGNRWNLTDNCMLIRFTVLRCNVFFSYIRRLISPGIESCDQTNCDQTKRHQTLLELMSVIMVQIDWMNISLSAMHWARFPKTIRQCRNITGMHRDCGIYIIFHENKANQDLCEIRIRQNHFSNF